MKESKKNVTESVTDEIETLEDNFRSLDKNMQAEQKEPDIYSAKLPIILEELRSQDKQVVSEEEWYKYTALACVPFAGAVYMLLQGSETNLNKRNFFLASFKTNLVYSVVFIIISVLIFLSGNHIGKKNSYTDRQEAVSQEQTVATDTTSGEIPDVTYSSNSTFDFELDGVKMSYPITAKQLKDSGYTYLAQSSLPYQQAVLSSYSNTSGTKAALTITLSDTPQDEVKCSEMQINFSDRTDFLGLNKQSGIDKARSVFATAKEDVTDFDEGTQTGSVVYSTGTFKVTVSLKNGTVSSVTIR